MCNIEDVKPGTHLRLAEDWGGIQESSLIRIGSLWEVIKITVIDGEQYVSVKRISKRSVGPNGIHGVKYNFGCSTVRRHFEIVK